MAQRAPRAVQGPPTGRQQGRQGRRPVSRLRRPTRRARRRPGLLLRPLRQRRQPPREAAKNAGQPIAQSLIKAAYEAENVGAKLDAWEAFSPGWLKAAAGSLTEIRGLSTTLGALGIIADAGTIISPQDKGAMGWVDRGAAGNGGLLVANMFLDEIPVVGEVTLVATGVYLAGDFLYHHFKPFHDLCDDVGHATVTVAKSVGHAPSSAWHSASSTVGSWF